MDIRGLSVIAVALGVVASCGEADDAVPTGSATAPVAATTPAEVTEPTEPAGDAAVLASAVVWRATRSNGSGYGPDRFEHLYIVERLGQADAEGFITGEESGRPLGDGERAAIAAALAPRTVDWVASWEAVVDEQATTTLPEGRAIITIAEPAITGGRAEVAIELWCGFDGCASGSTLVLERSQDGAWTVTEQLVGWVS